MNGRLKLNIFGEVSMIVCLLVLHVCKLHFTRQEDEVMFPQGTTPGPHLFLFNLALGPQYLSCLAGLKGEAVKLGE